MIRRSLLLFAAVIAVLGAGAPYAFPQTITSLTPNAATAGSSGFTMRIDGQFNTLQASAVYWTLQNQTSTLNINDANATTLFVAVPASLLTVPGTAVVQVFFGQTPSNTLNFTINSPSAPTLTLTSISPTSAVAGGPAFTLTVNGSNFNSGTSITWNGSSISTYFVSTLQLTATIPASLIATAGSASVDVAESGQVTPEPLTFTITQPPLVLTSISPNSAIQGSSAFTLTGNGSGFSQGAQVTWNGTALATSFINATQLTAAVPASLIATAGSASVTVAAPNQNSPSPLSFTIIPALTITSLSPSSATAGGPSFTLTVNGAAFDSSTSIYWNGTALSTVSINGGQISVTVPANLIAQPGSASINAKSSTQVSNTLNFTIAPPPLTLTSISPSSAVAGGPAFTLTANGSGFSSGAQVTWNGTALTTSFVSATQLTASVPAALIATVGAASVGVAAPNQISPAPLPFSIVQGITLTSLSPSSAAPGGPTFLLTVNGTGFSAGTLVYWNNLALPSTVTNANLITATVPGNLIVQAGSASITAQNGNVMSNALTFSITSSPITLTSLSPSTAAVGSPALTLTVNGAGFLPPSSSNNGLTAGTTVTWNGTALTTQFVSTTQLTATVPAALLASAGTAAVSVTGQSATLAFTVIAPLTLSSISPSTITSGGPGFNLTVNGTGFSNVTLVTFNGSPLVTTFVSSTQLTAAVPATLVASTGTASIDVSAAGGQTPPAALRLVITTGLNLTSLIPSSATAGGPAFTLTVNGNGFTSSATVNWNSTALATTFVSTTQLTAAVPANLIAQAGSVSITASNGNLVSNSLPFTISPPTPTISSLSPATAAAGSPAFTLTVNGNGFLPTSNVSWNGANLPTTYVSGTQLTASVTANLVAQQGSANVVVTNGATRSNTVVFTITPPAPVITSIAPTSVMAGGPTFTLTVNGTGFVAGAAVSFNSTALVTTFVSGTQVTAGVPASLIAQAGTAQITISNPGGAASNAVALTITTPTPTITSIAPSSVAAGSAAFTLTVTGTNFLNGATVSLGTRGGDTALTTTFVSATQLTAAVPANLIAQAGSAQITAANSGGTVSNAVSLTITAPTPSITSITPTSVTAGGAAFTLTVNGTNFLAGVTVSLNSTALTTTLVSATQVTAAVPANLIAQPGTANITATNTGGTASNAVSLTINSQVPAISQISPATVTQGGTAFTLTVVGNSFVSGATVLVGTTSLTTTFVSTTQLTAAVPANLIAQPGTLSVTVTNPGSAASNALSLTVTPPPTISSISPSSITAGGPAFALTVTGTNFTSGSTVSLNSTSLATTFVSATQITAAVPANLIGQPGTAQITVANSGGPASNAVTLTITAPPPTLSSISPATVTQGGPAFTLTVNGTGFVSGATVLLGTTPVTTTFASSTQLTAAVPASLIQQPGPQPVTVTNPGSAASNPLPLTVTPPTPTITSISPSTVTAGGAAFTLTVNGTSFLTGAVVLANGNPLNSTVVSATELTAQVPANLIAQPGSLQITAVNMGGTPSTAVTLTIAPVPATLTSLSPASATAGSAAFTLTVNGTGFISGAAVNFGTNALATTFVSATQLTAAVPASLLLTPGSVQVSVQQGGTSSNALSFTVNLPAAPSLRLNPPANVQPAQQPTIDFGLNSGYPLALSGTVTLSFVSNATVPVVDPAIQFAGGGATMTFTVPPNTTTLPALLISTGTVAGTITISVTLTAGGVNVTPSGSTATIVIAKAAPVILPGKLTLVRATGYLEVDITGFATTRDMTQAVFQLNAVPNGSFTTSTITVPLGALFTTWYQSAASTQFGSQFTYAQPFSVIGDVNQIQSVTVTLTDSAGSVTMTSN